VELVPDHDIVPLDSVIMELVGRIINVLGIEFSRFALNCRGLILGFLLSLSLSCEREIWSRSDDSGSVG